MRRRAIPILLLSILCAGNATSAPAEGEQRPFQPVGEARVESRNGVPMILLNGEPRHPMTFFFNTGMRPRETHPKLGSQVRAAARAGVDVYSGVDFLDWREPGTPPDMALSNRAAGDFLEANPHAYLIPRIWAEVPRPWPESFPLSESERVHYSDGTIGSASLASQLYFDRFYRIYGDQIRVVEEGPWGGHVLGYHFGGVDPEWINHGYRERGPDYSPVATEAFRQWLRRRHGDEAALQEAWGRPDVTFDNAGVPREESWFPIHTRAADLPLQVFHKLPAERDWVDYKNFVTDLNVRHILDGARTVKEATGGRKLSVTFYGYAYDLPGGLGGHQGMMQILRSPDVDILVAPVSYIHSEDRMAGGPAGYMTAVDSVALHGKLWFNEDDMRTWLIDPERDLPQWLSEGAFGQQSTSFRETVELLERNFASLLVHRAGAWWMDLIAAGAFNDIGLWEALAEVLPLYKELLADPFPYRPEVALLVDERSAYYRRMDYGMFMNSLPFVRNAAGRAGFQVGYYYLEDFIDGNVPPCKAYLFVNPWYLDDEQIAIIHQRLAGQDATAIWQFAPGLVTDGGWSTERTEAVTGIPVSLSPGRLGSTGTEAFANLSIPARLDNPLEARLSVVAKKGVEILAHYGDGGLPSAARTRHNGFTSYFMGDLLTAPPVVSELFARSGAHRWTEGGEIVHTDGCILAVHAGDQGSVTIHAPAGRAITPLDCSPLEEVAPGTYRGDFESPETRWFRIVPREPEL